MHMSRLAGLAAIGGLVAAFATAAPAMAADVDSLTCAFTGLAGTANPTVPAVVNTVSRPLATGGFQFNGSGTCALVDTDATVGVGTANIGAAGNFTNVVCGTGLAQGHGTITPASTLAGSFAGHSAASSDFTIAFVAGNGAMAMTNASDGDGILPTGVGAGYVNIVPDALNGGGDCVLNDVSRFQVTGAFTAVA